MIERRAAALTRSPSLRRQDAQWAALPIPGGAWPPAVQDARVSLGALGFVRTQTLRAFSETEMQTILRKMA
jgi:hypothetical protein